MTTTDRPLSYVIADTPTPDLKALRTLLHRTGDRARIGWPNARSDWARRSTPMREADYPAVLAGVCREISAELAGRGDPFGPCPACADAPADKPEITGTLVPSATGTEGGT